MGGSAVHDMDVTSVVHLSQALYQYFEVEKKDYKAILFDPTTSESIQSNEEAKSSS